jgi:hypothetical protein
MSLKGALSSIVYKIYGWPSKPRRSYPNEIEECMLRNIREVEVGLLAWQLALTFHDFLNDFSGMLVLPLHEYIKCWELIQASVSSRLQLPYRFLFEIGPDGRAVGRAVHLRDCVLLPYERQCRLYLPGLETTVGVDQRADSTAGSAVGRSVLLQGEANEVLPMVRESRHSWANYLGEPEKEILAHLIPGKAGFF